MPPGTDRPRWSVMIPTYNCADHLRAALAGVLAQDPGPEEMQIEVVDDASEDDPESVVAELGGGVSASVPLALYTTGALGDTTWRPAAAAERFALTDRATRPADVALLWMVPQHFYPYFDVVSTDWMKELPTRLAEAALDEGTAALHRTLRRLVQMRRDYPVAPLVAAIETAVQYGLYDLDRLERMILRNIATAYFIVPAARAERDPEDDDEG